MRKLTPEQLHNICLSPAIRERFDTLWIPEPNSGCHLWMGDIEDDLYGRFHLFRADDGNSVHGRAHRVSWFIHRGLIPSPRIMVCHKCDVKLCVNDRHLFLGTALANMRDAARKNRLAIKLTDAEREEIRRDPRLLRIISAERAVSIATISRVKTGHDRR